jgi:hypothetical protein
MTTRYDDRPDLAVAAAIALRMRLRALAAGQADAFDLLYYEFGGSSPAATAVGKAANRLTFLAFLLADLAWTNGEQSAHDAELPPRAAEAEAVCRVFRHHVGERRRYPMNPEQRTAVVAYLDALLLEVGRCIELEEHAPSARLGREAREFIGAVTEMRRAAVLQ